MCLLKKVLIIVVLKNLSNKIKMKIQSKLGLNFKRINKEEKILSRLKKIIKT